MGNSLPSIKEATSSSITTRSLRSFPDKIKKFAKGNITALLAKKGWKLHPRFHLKLSFPSSQVNLQSLLKFMHKNRTRIASLKKLSVYLNATEVLPLLLTTVSIRPLVRSLGQRLSRLRNVESAEIGTSQLNALSIEETLIESITKMKKITALSLGIPDNQNKINVIAKKLVHLKRITKLNLDFFVEAANIKPIFNSLRCCSRLQELKINLKDCTVTPELIYKLGETLKKMKKLEHFILHIENTTVQDEEINYLYETIENNSRIGYFKIFVHGCPNLSWWMRAKIYAKKNRECC